MSENHNNLIEIKLPTEDAKNTTKGTLIGIPELFLVKVKCIYLFFIYILYVEILTYV